MWARLIKSYLRRRESLTAVFVLIECTVGVTAADEAFMCQLDDLKQPFNAVLTVVFTLVFIMWAQYLEVVV